MVLIHDEHVWLCDRDTKEFDQVNSKDARKACDNVPVAADISAMLSSRWSRPPKPTGIPPTFVSSAAVVLAVSKEATQVVTNGRVEDLFVALWEGNHEPGSIRLDKGIIDGFTVRLGDDGKQVVRVGAAIDAAKCGDQVLSEALTSRTQVVFEEHLARGRAAFQPIDGLSVYSESLAAAFRSYTRGPRVDLLVEPAVKAPVSSSMSRGLTPAFCPR